MPLVMTKAELDLVKERIVAMADAVAKETGVTVEYQVGTMIELPRAALRAGEIAEAAEFFSFGTNDLTQTALGISRDDAASFLGLLYAKGILPADPFVTIDQEGVGELIRIAAERGQTHPQRHQARDLRRAWRRPGLDPFLQERRARLRVLLTLPGADRAARSRPGGAGKQGREPGLTDRGSGKFVASEPLEGLFAPPAACATASFRSPVGARSRQFRRSSECSPASVELPDRRM